VPDNSIGHIIIDLLIVLLFVLINAFFSATEMAVITLNDNKIRKMAEDGHKSARKILRFIDKPGNFFAIIQVGVTLAGFLSSAFASDKFSVRLMDALDPNGNIPALKTVSMIIVTIILSYFSLVLGELVPKRLARQYPEKIAFAAAGIVRGCGVFLAPFVKLLTFSTNTILKLMGIDPNANEKNVTEEEIRMMVDVGSESGSIEDDEKEMIENIFEFNDKEVSEIMTHRTKIVSLPIDATYDEVMHIAIDERYTRIPVYQDTIDDIVGILHIKDLLGYSQRDKNYGEFSLQSLLRPPLVVPETKNLSALFREMQKGRMQLAVIVDEYGGTAGIATIEDMLEEIVGNITDEFDEEEQQIVLQPDGDYLVSGDTPLSDIENVLDLDLPDEDYDTIAGFVIHLLDRIPDEKETPEVTYGNVVVKVESVEDKWISKVRIHVLPKTDNETREDFGEGI
jgi:putative hemolysin